MLFHECSEYIYDWIKNQNHVKEESLTDWLLYEISQRCPSIYYQAFSRHEEAHNGSDWEWWIIVPDCNGLHRFHAYRFVVQAKKLLSECRDNYAIINYANRYGTQIDLLLDFARNRNALPLYMYYSTAEPEMPEQIKNITYLSEAQIQSCEDCLNGCFLSLASDVYDLLYKTARQKLLDYQVLNHSFKLSLLDEGFEYSGVEVDQILNELNNRLFRKSMWDKEIYGKNKLSGIKYSDRTVPDYLSVFLRSRQENMNWFENEMRITDIAGLGVIDLREQ